MTLDLGHAVLLAPHDVEFAAHVADEVVVMAEGEVVSSGPPRRVLAEAPADCVVLGPGAETVVAFGLSTDMCVSTTIRTGANLGWKMVLVADASDCFDLPDGQGGIIPGRAIHDAHVATLAYEFCDVVDTAELLPLANAA